MAPKRNSKPSSDKGDTHRHEWAGLAILVFSAFIGVALVHPEWTGLVGRWAVRWVAQTAVGQANWAVPIVGVLVGVSFLINSVKWRRVGGGAVLLILIASLGFEQLATGAPRDWQWPLPAHGGGVLGWGLFCVMHPLIGGVGVALFCIAVTALGIGVAFNLSFLRLFRRIGLFFMANQESPRVEASKLPKSESKSIWRRRLSDLSEPQTRRSEGGGTSTIPEIVPDQAFPTDPADFEPLASDDLVELAPDPVVPNAKVAPKLVLDADPTDYEFPPLGLLDVGNASQINSKENLKRRAEQSRLLEEALASFQVDAKVVNITSGPSVTRFELAPGVGVKIAKITALAKDIALKLAAPDVRIEAPIPGKALVGIEVPNIQTDMVTLRSLLEKTDFFSNGSKLLTGIGLTITGEATLMDLAKMPHVLIAGATGAGKSVCVNGLIVSILLRARPDEVKFLMIDPKKVELSLYEGIPHLVAPVVTDPHKAAATLNKWALVEMERRYETFSKVGVKNIEGFNQWVKDREAATDVETDSGQAVHEVHQKLPYIVVIIDELADLMMVASQEVENTICRLAQMSRATGIHLVIATQRPSVDVITGLIKANVPSRISFFLQSQIDSRTILDMPGAEKLLGKGDMLYSPVGSFKPQRVQGVFVSEKEVKAVVQFLKIQGAPTYVEAIMDVEPLSSTDQKSPSDVDELFDEAKQIVLSTQYASTSYLQRKLRIGYNRAARLMEELERQGVVSPQDRRRNTP